MLKKLEERVTSFTKQIDLMSQKMNNFRLTDIVAREKNQHWHEMRTEGLANEEDIPLLIKRQHDDAVKILQN